jgi:hypothetical protein
LIRVTAFHNSGSSGINRALEGESIGSGRNINIMLPYNTHTFLSADAERNI